VDNAECGVRIYGKTIPPTQICASTRGLGSPCGVYKLQNLMELVLK